MTDNPSYQPINPAELQELSREAGRQLTEREALEYLKRKVHKLAVENMLKESGHESQ